MFNFEYEFMKKEHEYMNSGLIELQEIEQMIKNALPEWLIADLEKYEKENNNAN